MTLHLPDESKLNLYGTPPTPDYLPNCQKLDSEIVILIEDDGVGMKTVSERSSKGFGLYAIEERLKLLGGSLTVDSIINQGSIIQIKVPYMNTEVS